MERALRTVARRWARSAGTALACWLPLSLLAAAAAAPPEVLSPGASVGGDFRVLASHGYAVDLAAGEYARVVVTLRGAAVRVVVRSPFGDELLRVSSLVDRYGTISAAVVARVSGRHLFAVEPQSRPEAAAGGYSLCLAARRPARAEDRVRTAAEGKLAMAGELVLRGLAADLAQAGTLAESTLPAWTSLGDPAGEAAAHYLIGLSRLLAGRHAEAAPHLLRAATLWRQLGDRFGLSKALHQIGRVRRYLGDQEGAAAAFQESLALSRESGQDSHAALTLYALGQLAESMGDLAAARASYEQAREIFRAQEDRSGEALILDVLGDAAQRQGRAAEALDHFESALALARGAGNENLEAESLDRLGRLRSRLGLIYPAIESFAAAIERYRAAGNPASEGLARVDLGGLLAEVGEAAEGRRMLEEALVLLRDPRDQAQTRLLLARLAAERGETGEALALGEQALATGRAMEHPQGEAAALATLGFLDLGRGEVARAHQELVGSLALSERVGDLAAQAEVLRGLGQEGSARGDLAAAEGSFARALALARQLGDATAEARILEETARVRRARGDLGGARAAIEEALVRIESLHARVAGDHLRASHLAAQREAYEIEVDVLEQLDRRAPAAGLAALAFETAERARARGMLDFLDQARVDLREGDPELAREEERLRLELNARSTRRAELLADPGRSAEVAKLDRELAELTGSYEIAEARLAASSPAYARLRQPEVRLGDLQREALDGGTILLEYFLAEPRSYLWRVAPDSLRSFELPGRERIEALAQRVRGELGQPSPETGTAARRDLTELAGMLLGPVAGELGDQRVAVVADGALLYVPFAALPVPAPAAGGQAQGPAAEPLVVRHEVVHLPSAAVVRELRRAHDGRPRAPAAVALFADPVFTPDDPRVHPVVAGAAPVPDASRDGPRNAAATDSPARPSDGTGEPWADLVGLPRRAGAGWRFLRLPWTRREAEVIAAEAGSREKRIALDFAANREVATGGDLARYRIVHFATHGVLDTGHPALSGLVLSEVDERGRERDGFLRLHDIYHLHLGADLVVLSGCDTALGEVVRGEGIVGLARGFFHAGASQVVASLWPIRDRATAELMQLFYRAMFHDRLAPVAALRQAQLTLRRQQPWRDPFFWAGFTLEGDWRVPAP